MIAKTLLAAVFAASVCLAAPALAQVKTEPKQEHKDKKEHKGEEKHSAHSAKIGEAAPDFKLTDTSGKTVTLAEFKGKTVVLTWFNPECPVIVQHCKTGTTLKDLSKDFKDKGVVFLAINSSGAGMEGSGTEKNANAKKEFGLDFPILLDESGTVGRSYGAKTTPHCFVVDKTGKLVYAGAIDNGSMGKNGDKNYVREALTAVLADKPVATAETRSYGCGVKYAKSGK